MRDAYANLYQAPLFGALFPVATNEAPVDESAPALLRLAAQIARVNAEIRRLKTLHPNWTPPTTSIRPRARATTNSRSGTCSPATASRNCTPAIALRMKNEPGWQTVARPDDQDRAQGGDQRAHERRRTPRTGRACSRSPTAIRACSIAPIWTPTGGRRRVPQVGLATRAFEIYHAILASCSDHDERLATVRKAISRFSVDQVKSLIAMGAKSDDGASEFDAAKIDLTRARIAAVNSGGKADDIEGSDLDAFFAEAARSAQRGDLALAGWWSMITPASSRPRHGSLWAPRRASGQVAR